MTAVTVRYRGLVTHQSPSRAKQTPESAEKLADALERRSGRCDVTGGVNWFPGVLWGPRAGWFVVDKSVVTCRNHDLNVIFLSISDM